MDTNLIPPLRPSDQPPAGAEKSNRFWSFWPVCLLGLLIWQGWMTWCLLGKQALLSDQPILSGAHAQHLYLGLRRAQSLYDRGSVCCYDESFDGGYPNTPIFNGSRLAELLLFLAGGTYHPAAYKIGLAGMCMLVPWLLLLGGRGLGLAWPVVILGVAAGQVVWWSPFSYDAVQAGSSELQLGSLAILAHAGLLVRFHRHPGVTCWLGLIATTWLGWFAQPMLFPVFLMLFLVYYVNVGHSHDLLFWHGSLLLAEVLSLVLTVTWTIDWVTFWWLRAPLPAQSGLLAHRTLQTIWDAPLWGGPLERGLVLSLMGSALGGVILLPRSKRTSARMLAVGVIGLFVLALLGISWEPLGSLGSAGLLAPSLWFACLPAAHAWERTFALLGRALGGTGRAVFLLAAVGAVAGGVTWEKMDPLYLQWVTRAEPLQFTLGPERQALIAEIKKTTNPDARILWEDMPRSRTTPHWTPLLPLLTERSFVGGLDPEATIEHATIGLANQTLQNEPIENWQDQKLEEFCTRYNIGWAVCFSPAAIKRFSTWPMTERPISVMDGDQPGVLFTISRRNLSYALKGQAELREANCHHITLAHVIPENGVVVLSLHYQAGMRASPSRVHVEAEPSDADPIGFLRLRMAGPADRVTLTWDDR
jgi:hypothetical protein